MSLRFIKLSGNFIYQNYRQALERIQIDTPQLAALSTRLGIGPDDFERYLEEERAYLTGLRQEPEGVKETADYMDLLFELDDLQYVLSQPFDLYVLTKSTQEKK
jgi:hypothetical protein